MARSPSICGQYGRATLRTWSCTAAEPVTGENLAPVALALLCAPLNLYRRPQVTQRRYGPLMTSVSLMSNRVPVWSFQHDTNCSPTPHPNSP